ncbi:DHS-like NAD/FAD-binding domain-containing protein [Xylariaceae sp. FL1019]|nr:DHS-like NAD/FAD-binding domain-containing protein [Xylariaceae sp. FL1019]
MGQESSTPVSDDTPPDTLSERSLKAVAELIKSGDATQIVVMTGAGISTAAGIPDFRSPRTGLYHNLARLNLPHPEAVFELDFFKQDPRPFYVLAKELHPGKFKPTISHVFIALLAKKKLLRMLFTQNIDCLERAAGVPPELIVEAHGSFASQRCIYCKTPLPDEEMREAIEKGDPPSCVLEGCEGIVKPDIVFFGEGLPNAFFNNSKVPAEADLAIVMGTSLSVGPFNMLPTMPGKGVPRLLLNMECVGDFGTRADDVLCLGDCDAGIRKLADELGWRDELETMWVDIVGEKEAERQREGEREHEGEDEVDQLVKEVQEKFELSESEGPEAHDATGFNSDSRDQPKVHDQSPEEKSKIPAATSTGVSGSDDVAASEEKHAKPEDESHDRKDEEVSGVRVSNTGASGKAEDEKKEIKPELRE